MNHINEYIINHINEYLINHINEHLINHINEYQYKLIFQALIINSFYRERFFEKCIKHDSIYVVSKTL